MSANAQQTDRVNWGLLSTARINQALIPPLRASRRAYLVGVASRDSEHARSYAKEWDIPRAYGSYEEMLADPDIQIIYNSLPNHMHAEWTIKAARAGKHVLCEKPLALSLQEVDQMTQAARENGVIVQEAFMYLHHPATLKTKELVNSGAIGKPSLMQGNFSFLLIQPDDYRWDAGMGGGALWDVGCYPISFSLLVAGGAPVEVVGWQSLSSSGVDALFAGQLRFRDGCISQIQCSFTLPFNTRMTIHGTAGSLIIPAPFKPDERAVIIQKKEDSEHKLRFSRYSLYTGEVENMIDAVLGVSPQRLTLQQSRDHIATILALLESARSGGKPVLLT